MLFELLVCKVIAGVLTAGAVAAVVAVSFAAVKSWINQNAVSGDIVELIKREMSNAVVIDANIISKKWYGERIRTSNSWQEKAIDQELKEAFAGGNKMRYKA
jgi:hypothetical protein